MNPQTALIGTFVGVLTLLSTDGLATSIPTPTALPRTEAGLIELAGNVPEGISRNSAAVMNSHVAIYVERLAKSGRAIPEQTTTLMAAAKAALDAKDYGRAYRFNVRALGWAHGANQVEAYEVAGSFAPALNRALFSSGENITLTVHPQFALGHALANRYSAESWLETPAGPVTGSAQKLTIDDLREYHFDHPVQLLPDGIIAVCYRLVSPAGETLAELKHAVVVAKDVEARLEKMKAGMAAASQPPASGRTPAFVTVLDTVNYAIRSLEQERAKFDDGSFGRSGSALGKYLIQLNWTAAKIPVAPFPPFDARLRYPQDVDLAESLVTALAADSDALLERSGDMALACESSKNDELLRYRIFVPEGYDRARKYSLIVALHSGAGDGEFFEFENLVAQTSGRPRENAFKRLAQERGCILVCPKGGQAGFSGERGETDVLDVIDRVQTTFSVDAKQVFLTGWSGGSEAAWRIALKHPDRFAAAAPVGVTPGIAKLLTPQATERARDLPILYSIPGTEAEQGRMLSAAAKPLLRRFTCTEYPKAEHADVWLEAQPALFDFFAAAAGNTNTRSMP
jgi:pimeloyl-ACP methyl ester carboxylesterase